MGPGLRPMPFGLLVLLSTSLCLCAVTHLSLICFKHNELTKPGVSPYKVSIKGSWEPLLLEIEKTSLTHSGIKMENWGSNTQLWEQRKTLINKYNYPSFQLKLYYLNGCRIFLLLCSLLFFQLCLKIRKELKFNSAKIHRPYCKFCNATLLCIF